MWFVRGGAADEVFNPAQNCFYSGRYTVIISYSRTSRHEFIK